MSGLRLAPPSLPVSLLAAAASGILLWLALPPVDAGPLGFVALVPLLWVLRGVRARRGALAALASGVVFYAVLLSWLIPLSILGWAVLTLGVAAWLALFGAYVVLVWRDDRPIRTALAVGAGWGAVEWLRSVWPFGGWHWVGLGYTQHDNPLMLPAASVIGALGLAFLLAAVNALLLLAALRWGRGRRMVAPAAAAVALAAVPVLVPFPRAEGPPVDVAIVQGSVPEQVGTATRILEDRIVAENHAAMHLQLTGDPPDLAVWPENALDRDPTRDPESGPMVEHAIRSAGAYTLVGAITEAPDGRLLNENLLYTPSAEIVDRYAKIHLLPFGEYVPFREQLGWIPDVRLVREDLSPGREPGRFTIPTGGFAAAICFENAFPNLVRTFVDADAGYLVISTNNSTFGRTAAPDQHLVLSELRAVENGRWVVHAALSGKSGFVSPRGEVVASTGLFERTLLRGDIRRAEGRTVFNRIGGWLPAVLLLGAGMGLVGLRRPPRREVEPLGEDVTVNVVLPTFNERDSIEEVLERVLAADPRIHVTVVDDSSPDGTGEVVRKIAQAEPRVDLDLRPEKGGLASAYIDGFVRAIASGYDVVVEMDADLSHRPDELPRLIEGIRRHHLVIGSRYVPGGGVRNWSLLRRVLSRGGNLYARLLLGFPVRDATSGFRAYRRDALRELITHQVRSEGYAFQVELAYRAWRRGMSVGEVPITFEERRHGHSKLSRAIVVEALWYVLLWSARDRLVRRGAPERPPSDASA